MANTIRLNVSSGTRHDEIVANAAISPGMLVERRSDGKGQAHSTSGGRAEMMVALEDGLRGKTVNDAYAANDPVPVLFGLPGDEVQLLLKGGENVANGASLTSAGDGTVKGLATSGSVTEEVVAIALEAKDLSSSGNALISARIVPQVAVTSPA